jgi:hypothetical protein
LKSALAFESLLSEARPAAGIGVRRLKVDARPQYGHVRFCPSLCLIWAMGASLRCRGRPLPVQAHGGGSFTGPPDTACSI